MTAREREQLQLRMAALAAGDRSAFDPVFTALWPLVRSFCQRTLDDAGLAEDAAQSALMKLLLHATEFRPEGDAVAWALGFASSECRSIRNRTARRREEGSETALAGLPGGAPSPESAALEADLHAAAMAVVGTLRPIDAETIRLAVTDERPGASPVFRKRLQRALDRLRLAWRHTHGSHE